MENLDRQATLTTKASAHDIPTLYLHKHVIDHHDIVNRQPVLKATLRVHHHNDLGAFLRESVGMGWCAKQYLGLG